MSDQTISNVYHVLITDDECSDCIGLPDIPIEEETPLVDQIPRLKIGSELTDWIPVTIEFFKDDDDSQLEFYNFDGNMAVVSQSIKLFDAIDNVELLPLGKVIGLPPYVQNNSPWAYVVHYLERIDLIPGSDFELFEGSDVISNLRLARLSKTQLVGRPLFKLAQNPVSHFCTEEFKVLVEKAGAKGLTFSEPDFDIEIC